MERFNEYVNYPIYLDFEVVCPRDSNQEGNIKKYVYPMQIKFINNNGPFPLPCNGCENMNGDKRCCMCINAITDMFFNNPELEVIAPIVPDIKVKKTQH